MAEIIYDPSSNSKKRIFDNGDGSHINLVKTSKNLSEYRVGFEATVASGVNTAKAKLLKTGSGMSVSQTNGKLNIVSGTTAKSETVIRLQDNNQDLNFNVPFNYRAALMLSARNANQSFIFEMVDLLGDNLAYNATSATAIVVTLPNHGFDSVKDIGKKVTIGIFNNDVQPSQDVAIASISGNDITFTGAGFTVGTGTCSLFGLNAIYMIYDGTSATSYKIGARRNGRDFVAGGSSVTGTTSTAMLTDYMFVERNSISWADKVTAWTAANNKATRACIDSGIPDAEINLVAQIRVVNGTTAPATATLTVDFVSICNAIDPVGVNIFATENGGASPLEVKLATSYEAIGNVGLTGGTNVIGKVNIEPAPTVFADTTTNLAASATFTGTSRDAGATIAMRKFTACAFADQAGTFYIDMSTDNTTWRQAKKVAVAANDSAELEVNVVARYYRTRFVNGSTLQTAFMINSAYHKL